MVVAGAAYSDSVIDLLERYGEEVSDKTEQRSRETLQLLKIENARREIQMHLAQACMLSEQRRLMQLMESVAGKIDPSIKPEQPKKFFAAQVQEKATLRLSVLLRKATALPRMDYFSLCDPYAILYVNGFHAQAQSSSTIRREINPEWDEHFEWEISKSTTMLSITIWDKDMITKATISWDRPQSRSKSCSWAKRSSKSWPSKTRLSLAKSAAPKYI
ncbi:C2 domain-containing protein [Baffinella frigidus]|nr:C2 domain-containing protein [Cryptophyta sp. CCMP2293]